MNTARSSQAIKFLLLFFLIFGAMYLAKPFLVPLAFGGLLSMLLLPLNEKMERKGMNRAVAILISILLMVALIAGLLTLLGWQISNITDDIAKSEQKIMQMINNARQFISQKFDISPEKQMEMIKKQQSASSGKVSGIITGIFSNLGGILVDTILVLVYIFLLTFYREKLRGFVLRLVSPEDKGKASAAISQCRQVAFKYMSGMGLMIVCLWIMYSIGFTIAGVKNAFFFAILCGTLELVPFVGNLTGTALTIVMAVTQGGDASMVLGVVAVYFIVQFLQTYILEPLVVGSEVSLNPLFTIIAIVAGELVWGIPGMVLAIPMAGIAKIIFDHVEPLKPYGYLLGEDKKEKNDSGLMKKIKSLFGKKKKENDE